MRWEQGRPAVDGMLSRGEIERVPASRDHAYLLLRQANQHTQAARAIESAAIAKPFTRSVFIVFSITFLTVRK